MPATARRIDPVRSLFEFTVEGKGEFPFDMLRYDQCWPADSESAGAIATPETLETYRAKRRVRLNVVKPSRAPTVDRWASFMWKLVD